MSKNKTRLILSINLVLIFAALQAGAISAQSPNTQEDFLATLMKGNERFVTGKLQAKDYLSERPRLAEGQHPYAVVLTCSDSRLSPEIIFDESLGKLFVIRTAGHVVDPVALGSIEYAVEHLHVTLLFVLGHEGCGAVKATISGGEASANIKALLTRIKPAVDKTFAQGVPENAWLKAAVAENVRYQMQKAIFESETLGEFIHDKKLAIAGGVYNLETGKVDLISTHLAVERIGGEMENKAHSDTQPAAEPVEMKKKAAEIEEKKESPHTEPKYSEPKQSEPKQSEPKQSEPKQSEPKRSRFEESVRLAYEKNYDVVVKKTMLMRDERDRCATDNCGKIAAGEFVRLDTPFVLSVMGRPQLKVRYKGKRCYISADMSAIEFSEN